MHSQNNDKVQKRIIKLKKLSRKKAKLHEIFNNVSKYSEISRTINTSENCCRKKLSALQSLKRHFCYRQLNFKYYFIRYFLKIKK